MDDGSSIQPVRLAVFISGGGRTLMNFLDEINAGALAAEVVLVIASGDCAGAGRARDAGLPVEVITRGQFDGVGAFSAAINAVLSATRPDLVALAGFLHLWRFPASLTWQVMNIHPALLPSFGGDGMYGHHVHEAVLAAGCKVSGCTVHFADLEYDTGPIIVQRTAPVLEGDTPDLLAGRIFQQECIAYPEAINLFAAGRVTVDGRVVRVLPQ